jgi:NAD(P)-dependent dehydrogenase (short-subunit alcohol dehydrogenase family)
MVPEPLDANGPTRGEFVPLKGLQDKVAIVTGAGTGIGSAVMLRLSEEAVRVALVDLDIAAAERAATALPGEALTVAADVSSEAGADHYIAATLKRFGQLDAVHLNAGYPGQLVPFVDSDPTDFA